MNIGTQLTLNMKMKVGGGTETVEVQSIGTELQTLNSTVGQTISQEAIEFSAQPEPRREYLYVDAAGRRPRTAAWRAR